MTTKRQIRGEKYNVSELVNEVFDMEASGQLTMDQGAARESLRRMGHTSPNDALISRFAREAAILTWLEQRTGAYFTNQIGKINLSNKLAATEAVNQYLNRRVQGMRQNWSQK